jgi:hypothetical protein
VNARIWRAAAAALAAASLLSACDGDSERVTPQEQRELPTSAYGLVQDLCFRGDSAVDRKYGREEANPRARRQFAALERSLRAHPDAIVRVEFTPADSPEPELRDMSVRELAETHLDGAKEEGLPGEARCFRRGRSRLARLLDGS